MARPCENQVRRIAGVVVAVGALLGFLWTPWAFIIPAFAGLNLLQSSFTGLCPAEWLLPACGTASN